MLAAWLLCSALAPTAPAPRREPEQDSCAHCHGAEALEFARSAHAGTELGCVSCHGGDPAATEVAAAHSGDFRALTEPRASVLACGECHADVERMRFAGLRTDQLALYRSSRHGQRLLEQGDEAVATCADCHGSHGVRPAHDPLSSVHPANQPATCGSCHADSELMGGYDLPADVVERYRGSVHGQAVRRGVLSSPSCTDCHGHHGALPPRVFETEQVCGQCHFLEQEQFHASPHRGALLALEAGASTEPREVQCATCHGDHGVERPTRELFAREGAVGCGACHAGDERALGVAGRLQDLLGDFEAEIDAAAGSIEAAARQGLYLDEERGFLDDARGLLAQARTRSHALSPDGLAAFLVQGRGMVERTEASLGTRSRSGRDRRIFAGLFLLVSLALAGMLWTYAREIRGSWRQGDARRRA